MHTARKYFSRNTQKNESQAPNTNIVPPNVYVPNISTGLEDKPLLPSVFRPSSTLYTAPLSGPKPYLSNAVNFSGSNNTGTTAIKKPCLDNTIGTISYTGSNILTIPAIQKPYSDNTVGYTGLNNPTIPAIQKPYLDNTVGYTGLNNPTIPAVQKPYLDNTVGYTCLNNPTIPAVQKPYLDNTVGYTCLNNPTIPAIQKLDSVFSVNNSAHAVSAQKWVPLVGSNPANLVTLSSSSLGFNNQEPLQSYESEPPYYHYTMPNTLPTFDERCDKDRVTIQDDGNPFEANLKPELPSQGSLRPVVRIDQNYSSVVDNEDNFISGPNDALEQRECLSDLDNTRPFFGSINTCSDLRLSSRALSFTDDNPTNRDFDLSSYSVRENNHYGSYVSDTTSDERSYENRERYSYLDMTEPKENRGYHNAPDYNSVEKHRSRRSYSSSSVDRSSYSNKRRSPRARSRSRSPMQRYPSTRTKERTRSPKQNDGVSQGRNRLRDERPRERTKSPKQNDGVSQGKNRLRDERPRERTKSPKQNDGVSQGKNRLMDEKPRERTKSPKQNDGVSQGKNRLSDKRPRLSPEPIRSTRHSPRKQDRNSSSSSRRSESLGSESSTKYKRYNSSSSKCGSKSEKASLDEKFSSPRRSNIKDDKDKGTSRALKCFCLPEPYVERKFVYEQSTRYYQSSSSSQKSTSTATDNVGKLQKEFEDLLSNSPTFKDCPLTTSVVIDPMNDPEEDSQYVSELLDKADNDVSSESDVDLEGFDVIDEYESDDSSEDEEPVMPIENRFKNQDHPRKLHREMWFNVEGELNHGKECLCSLQDRKKWIVHNVYPNEQSPKPCEAMGNNGLQLYHYWVTVFPHTNFMTENPTSIECNGRTYIFEGFSLLSHSPLDAVPRCFLTRFNFKYEIFFIQEPIPTNFCIKDLNLFSKFLFHDILELYDWDIGRNEEVDETCNLFHFLPRFTYKIGVSDDGCEKYELLSMRKVFEHLLKSHKPLITEKVKDGNYGSWKDFVGSCVNSVVTKPGWKPSSIRIDDVERDLDKDQADPVIVHHGIRPVQLSFSGDPKCQKLMKRYLKMRTLMRNKPEASQKERLQLIKMKLTLDNMRMKDSLRRDCCARVSSAGMMKTGLNSDVTQHALLLPVLVHHVRYHLSLQTFDEKIGYVFKDRSLLQLALTHPSYVMNYGTNPDHARNTLSNCGVKQPRYGDRRNRLSHTKKKGIVQLIDIMAKLEDLDGSQSFIQHNERLEFLGDAVLEFICTCHLYFLFPEMAEGGLVIHRSSLVQNKHLAQVSKKLDLDNFMQFSHGPDLCHQEDMEHAMANCLEAILGAIYLDSDVNTVQRVFCKLAFEEIELRKLWSSLSRHPLQMQQPEGDRQLISSSDVLKGLVKLEEAVGVQFTHIRLLARAFTHPQVGFNNLTLGNNQRMELLGDALVQWVVTNYLYRHFPEHHEGHLTLLRSSLVNRTIQAQIAGEIGLDQHVHFGVGPGVPKLRQKHLSDLFEAFLAALFVDNGIEPVEVFCKVCLFPRLRDVIVNQEWMDAKSQLQSCCLTQAKPSDNVPIYKVLKNIGSPNMKLFTVGVYFKGKRLGTGFGDSIRDAEMNAAQNALATNYFPEYARQKRVLKRKHNK